MKLRLSRYARKLRRRAFVLLGRARRAYRLRNIRIDINAQCPACGHRSGRIEFDQQQRVIVHSCMICRAAWGEPTVLETTQWL
jgi:transcription elongation factor Elf1